MSYKTQQKTQKDTVQDSVCACVQYKKHTCTLGLTTSAGDSRADEARRGGAVSPGGMSTLHLYQCSSPAHVPKKGGERKKTCHGIFAPVPLPLACSHVSSNVSIRPKTGGGGGGKRSQAYGRMATKWATARPTPTLVPTLVQRGQQKNNGWKGGKRLQGKKYLQQSR